MNRLFSKIFLFFLLTIMTFVSCASTSVEENLYDSVEAKIDPKTKKVYDFEGMNIIIGDWYTNPSENPRTPAEKSLKDWRDWSCNTYNMNIQQQKVWGPQGYFDMVLNYCVANAGEGDNSQIYDPEKNYVFIIDESIAQKGVKAGLFYDLSKISNISYYDMVKYNQAAVMKLTRGLSFYSFGWEMNEPLEGVYFNKRILTEHGYTAEYLYDLQAEGKWTWETFEEMCKNLTRDTDNDGIIDQYAMSSFNTEFSYLALDSNGAPLIGRDANGKYFNNAGSDKAMEAWNWIAHMVQNYQLPQAEGASWDYFYTAFQNGETAFLADQEYNAQPGGRFNTQMTDDWGFVCFPLGPSGDGVYKTLHDSNMCIIPSVYDAERVENIAKAVDLWLEPTPGYEGPDAWKEEYYAGFRDSRGVDETLELMAATPNPRFDTLIPGLSQGDMIFGVWGGWATPEEAYENSKNVWQSIIDDCNR